MVFALVSGSPVQRDSAGLELASHDRKPTDRGGVKHIILPKGLLEDVVMDHSLPGSLEGIPWPFVSVLQSDIKSPAAMPQVLIEPLELTIPMVLTLCILIG